MLVALCDNASQGIQPVPKAIGNGDDPDNNLYWGTTLGTRTFLRNSPHWKEVKLAGKPTPPLLDRIAFRHCETDALLVIDAYRGSEIRRCITDFLAASAGLGPQSVALASGKLVHLGPSANLVGFLGHNCLMDVQLAPPKHVEESGTREVVILACKSEPYFRAAIQAAKAKPYIWTTDLMAPEGYVLDAIMDCWARGKPAAEARIQAGLAYSRYQKCSTRSATRIFAAGL